MLRCQVCKYEWKPKFQREPRRCANPYCRSRRWREGRPSLSQSKFPWRSREYVQERHEYIIALATQQVATWGRKGQARLRPLTQMQIAMRLFEKFGNEETGKPIDHSVVIHHLRKHEDGRCSC